MLFDYYVYISMAILLFGEWDKRAMFNFSLALLPAPTPYYVKYVHSHLSIPHRVISQCYYKNNSAAFHPHREVVVVPRWQWRSTFITFTMDVSSSSFRFRIELQIQVTADILLFELILYYKYWFLLNIIFQYLYLY